MLARPPAGTRADLRRGSDESDNDWVHGVSSGGGYRWLRDGYGIAPGNAADLVAFDCADARAAVAELVPPLFGLKDGRLTFTRPRPTLRPQRGGNDAAAIGEVLAGESARD